MGWNPQQYRAAISILWILVKLKTIKEYLIKSNSNKIDRGAVIPGMNHKDILAAKWFGARVKTDDKKYSYNSETNEAAYRHIFKNDHFTETISGEGARLYFRFDNQNITIELRKIYNNYKIMQLVFLKVPLNAKRNSR